MKTFLSTIILAALIVGCVSLQTPAQRFLTTTAISVDTAMRGWAYYVVTHNVTEFQQRPVKAAYVQYQASFAAATNAYWISVKSNNPALFVGASNALVVSKSAVLTSTKH